MRFLLSMAVFLGVSTPGWTCDGLEVEHPWVRAAPPGAAVMAAYAGLTNTGDRALALDGVSSPEFGAAELHRTTVKDGIARMQRVQTLDLPPDGRALLEPGGLHIMLFRPARGLVAGDTVTITFHCGQDTGDIRFPVRSGAP